MPTNTSGGTTTSFMNTPQATDNSYVAGEDAIYTFDVMADDLGGNAKVLWSIDDVNLNGTTITSADGTTVATTSGDSVIDLTVKDAAGCVEKSQLGANIWIENGKVKYDSGPLDWLAAGQTAVDYFTYAIRLSNGTLSWATVQVTLTGTNDAPTISAADAAGTVMEDAAVVDGKLSDTGTITFDDVDLTDTHTTSVSPALGNTLGGTLTAIVSDPATGAGDGTVTWTYSVANSATQYLGEGDVATETFTIRISDNNGGYVDRTVTITVTGNGDAPVITAGNDTGDVGEDASAYPLQATGNLGSTDVDVGDEPTWTVSTGASYGTASIDPVTGEWVYDLDNTLTAVQELGEGDELTDTFVVTVTDEDGLTDTRTVTITVTGNGDGITLAPVYTGDDDPNNFDSANAQASGTNLITGTNGNDLSLNGTVAANTIRALDGHDTVNAGNGGDTVYGGNGSDTINGGQGDDLLYGQAGNDIIHGDGQNDQIWGGSGDDQIFGDNQDDQTLWGGSGSDTISGGDGVDRIAGGFGADTLSGGAAADDFVYLDVRDRGDTITDFQVGSDDIDLSAIDANSTIAGDQGFTFGGTTATANGVWYAHADGDTVVYVDVDGDANTAELWVTLDGTKVLTGGDFLLGP